MARPSDVEALKQLALLGGLHGSVELSSAEFAELIKSSQQTASRRLIELTNHGYVEREMGVRRQRIQLKENGRQLLASEYLLYKQLFEEQDRITIHGTVATGVGEGRYYLSRAGYQEQFREHLGWDAYPGTLNLELQSADVNKLRILKQNPTHTIHGFQAEGRTFGGVTCNPAQADREECAAILPNRSHYTNILELIAPVCLRDRLPCHDGDQITVTVHLPELATPTQAVA